MGEMTVALSVRAVAPAIKGAGVRWAGGAESGTARIEELDVACDGAIEAVKRARRYSYPTM